MGEALDRGSCPADASRGDISAEAAETVTKHEQITRAAQGFLDKPGLDETANTATCLRDELEARYALMKEYQPERAEALITRGMRSAGLAAWQHVLNEKLYPRVTPLLRSGQSITQNRFARWEAASKALPYRLNAPPSRTQAAWAIYMHTGQEWLARSREAVAIEMQADPAFPYRPLWEYITEIQRECSERVKTWHDMVEASGRPRPAPNPLVNIYESAQGMAFETLISLSTPLIVSSVIYSCNHNLNPAPEELSAAALADIHGLTWLASINRKK